MELNNILAEGQLLSQDSEKIAEQLQQSSEPHSPAFSLKTKVGLLMGTALVLAGSGVGMYMRSPSMTKKNEGFSSANPLNNTGVEVDQNQNHIKNNIIPSDILDKKLNIHTKREVLSEKIEGKFKKVDDDRYHLTYQTVQRCRDRLLNYVNNYFSVTEDTTNKDLALMILSFLSQDYFFDNSTLARMSLYGSGLFGERDSEEISLNVRHQLEGNLLSLLLYGQPLHDYVIENFSNNRYISIKDFRAEIVANDYLPGSKELSKEIRYFHDNYLDQVMPVFSLEFSINSNILFGSMTWFFIYLSSVTEWLDIKGYNETQAIEQGVQVLHHFISGDLEGASKGKINFGLQFCALYFNNSLTPESLPEFPGLWEIYRGEYVKYSNDYSNVEKSLAKIKENIQKSDTENKRWESLHKYADQILMEKCLKENPRIFKLSEHGREPINIREFVNLTTEHGWCERREGSKSLGAYKVTQIKIPRVKYRYDKLLNNALDIIDNINRFYLSSEFIRNDYFNSEMDWDDFNFIHKSALKLVSIEFRERRLLPLKLNVLLSEFVNTEAKDNFMFFVASSDDESRIYAIDLNHKEPLQKVREGADDFIKVKSKFFDMKESRFYENIGVYIKNSQAVNVSISRNESNSIFIEKIVNQQRKKLQLMINKQNADFLYMDEIIVEILKDILIPFYSCVTSIKQHDVINAFIGCLLDIAFIVAPAVRTTIKTTSEFVERMAVLAFMINKNKVFNEGGRIKWRMVIHDSYIYNSILNERSMLNSVFLKVLLESIDPGVGLITEIGKMFKNTASIIMKGELVRIPYTFIKHCGHIIECGALSKTLVDSSRKIIIKMSKPSGRVVTDKGFSGIVNDDKLFSSSLYDSAYQAGDYYAYYSSKEGIDLLMAVTGERTEDEDYIYVILGEDEFKGVLFRFYFRDDVSGKPALIPWLPLESNVKKIYSNSRIVDGTEEDVIFNHDVNNPFNNIIFYPQYTCHRAGVGLQTAMEYDIYKINDAHYLFDSEKGFLHPVYDGDFTRIIRRNKKSPTSYIMQDNQGDLIIRNGKIKNASKDLRYGVGHVFDLSNGQAVDEYFKGEVSLYISGESLFLNTPRHFFMLGLTNIKNQFTLNVNKNDSISVVVTWDSIEHKLVMAEPYLKKSSSHVGFALRKELPEYYVQVEKLSKYPTLLLSGAVLEHSELKLKVHERYCGLKASFNEAKFLLTGNKNFTLSYDLFTESFEPFLPGDIVSPYESLLKKKFPESKYPNLIDLINLNSNIYSNKLKMRLHQAAFLQRLNPVDRMDTLLLPIAQIYLWNFHLDTKPFAKIYPAAALWMTWQRQLHVLIQNNSPYQLPLIGKTQLQSENKYIDYTNGMLINSRYTDDEAIWTSNHDTLIFYTSEKGFSTKELEMKHGEKLWIPRVEFSHPLTVTQFMYEKNVHPKIIITLYSDIVQIIDNDRIGKPINIRYQSAKDRYFIMSPGGEWLAIIGSENTAAIYNLWSKTVSDETNPQLFFVSENDNVIFNCHPKNYYLLMLSDDGILYYPEDNTWHDSQKNRHLWSPPKNYSPSFISPDYRFLGFKNKDNLDVILYDQKRKKETQFIRPARLRSNGNITAVSFSALNAVVALAFDDGEIYLYDIISDRLGSTINPIASVKLDNVIHGKTYNNILMRIEGLFNSLTIIHPDIVWDTTTQVGDVAYTRSSYGFHKS